MPWPAPVCTPSTPHTNKHPSSWGPAAYVSWAYTGGPRIQRSPSTAPTDGAPRCCRPVASVQRLFQKHRCRVHRSLPSPQHAPPWTDWSRSTLTMLSFVARFMRILWKHSSWDAWRSTPGASSPCLVKTSADNAPRKSGRPPRATRPGRTGTRVSSRSFNPVGDRSGLRQRCRSRTLMDRSFYLSIHSSHASPHRCSRVSLLCRPPDRGSPHHH